MRRTTLLLVVSLVAALAVGLTVAGPASAGAGFTFVVKKTTPFNSVDIKDRNVRCPEGSQRTGGGVHIDGKVRNKVAIHANRPIFNGWRGAAHETVDPFRKNWSLTVRVVCEGLPVWKE